MTELRKVLFISTLVLMMTGSGYSQLAKMQLVGSPEKLTSELVAVRDANGRYCAAIQVISDMDGFSYDSYNGVVKVDDMPGKDMVYLTPDERVLEILHSGYEPLKIILSEIGIKLNPKDIWWIKINGNRVFKDGKGRLLLKTIPSGATITIDGIPDYSRISPYTYENLGARSWTFRINKDDYEPAELKIELEDDNDITEVVRLKPLFGYLKMSVNVDNPDIYINGIKTIPLDINKIAVQSGKCDISINKKYYRDFNTTIFIEPNDDPLKTRTLTAELVREQGILNIASSVKGARVYLNGSMVGSTPFTEKVPAGIYSVIIKKDEYRDEHISVEVLPNQTVKSSIELTKNGFISITGTSKAQVIIDNEERGFIPIQNLELEPGKHSIKVEKLHYDTYKSSIKIKPEHKTVEVNLSLSAGKPFRFTAFGNDRISMLSDGISMSIGLHLIETPPKTLEELTVQKTGLITEDRYDFGPCIDISYRKTPFTIGGSFSYMFPSELGNTTIEADTLESMVYFGYISINPFVLWEKLYPSIGGFYGEISSTYTIRNWEYDPYKKGIRGYYYDLRWHLSKHFLLRLTYLDYVGEPTFKGSLYLHFGLYL